MVPKLQALQRPISATNWQNVTSINHESEVWAALNLKWRNPKPFLGTPCSVGTNALSQRRVITTGAGFSKTGTPTVHFVLFAANKAARGQCGLNQVKYPCIRSPQGIIHVCRKDTVQFTVGVLLDCEEFKNSVATTSECSGGGAGWHSLCIRRVSARSGN